MIRKAIGLLFLFMGTSCGRNHASVLSISEMKPVMWDMLNADNWNFQVSVLDTTSKNKKNNIILYNKIFKQYDITREQFYNSYKYYELHPELMKTLVDSVEAYGLREKAILDLPKTMNKLKK